MNDIIDRLRAKLEELLVIPLNAHDEEKSFVELGVDSVVATEWINFIRSEFKSDLKVSALFDHPSLGKLATYLEAQTGPEPCKSKVSYSRSAVGLSPTAYPPIAVIGMSGRFPDADNVDKLWQNLESGVCSVKEIPANRSRYWDLAQLGSLYPESPIRGGFLTDVEFFDGAFFGIPAPEVSVMDPQQRLFLEEAWNAVEDAGYANEALSPIRCGVYAGVMNTDYHDLLTQVNARTPKVHELTGGAPSILAARVSYHLNLRGPAVAIDTACSSSITALHFACRALQLGEIDMALAGGVTLYLTQKRYHLMKQAGMLSRSGACRPFDDAADGTVPGEAVGVVVLKRLEDAVRDRDSIYGVIISSGINQDGKTNGITAPSSLAQHDLLREVYQRGNIEPGTVQYVEAHGTGTKLGDPIEWEALTGLFSTDTGLSLDRSSLGHGRSCCVGSVKANLGHTTAAAGITGLIKVLLGLQHRAIPPQIHFNVANRDTFYSESPFRVNTELEAWKPVSNIPRRAALSSFGFSGTNGHVVIQEAPFPAVHSSVIPAKGLWIVLSAKSRVALKRRARDLKHWLETKGKNARLIDVSFTLIFGRSALEERLAFIAPEIAEVCAILEKFLSGQTGNVSLWQGRVGEGRREEREYVTIGEAWVCGADVNWSSYFEGAESERLHLPTYPFAQERYWYDTLDPQPASDVAMAAQNQCGTEACRNKIEEINPTIRHRLDGIPIKERVPFLVEYLQRKAMRLLRMPAVPDAEIGFRDLGMDSLTAVELQGQINKDLQLDPALPATVLFDFPNPRCLAERINSLLVGSSPSSHSIEMERAASRTPVENETVAVVGLSCRFPGASDPQRFWQLLAAGNEAITEIPQERWNIDDYYDPNPEKPGKIYARRAGFLKDVEQFDNQFFHISPREAISMDPQHRLLLEVSWEALENAAVQPDRLKESRTGVYVGMITNEYLELIKAAGVESIDPYFLIGNVHSTAVGRISYLLGLRGPNLAIDTACSSSLVAVHQACKDLLLGECDLALAGGVNLILIPDGTIGLCRARMLAADGRCKAFDSAADGYVRGEGCGVLVLKRLREAVHDGDRILAMIRSSSVNQDGAGAGLTVPRGVAQEQVISNALRQAGLAPHQISYLEAHGTGTSLGDPIEIHAAATALGRARSVEDPLLVGSVKTNIGHPEAAAGIASLVKVILAMEHGVIPKQLHFKTPNPLIDWNRLPVKIVTEATPWPAGKKIAGVNSFGMSGVNAHVIVEEPPETSVTAHRNERPERSHHVLALSARTEKALSTLAESYREWLRSNPEIEIGDVAFTAGVGRNHMEERAALVVSSAKEANEVLEKLAQGQPVAGVLRNRARVKPKMAWLFTGQGSQYIGMGRELYRTQPVVQEVLDRCAALLAECRAESPATEAAGGGLLEVLFGERRSPGHSIASANGAVAIPALDHTSYTQPALYAIEMALAELLRSWGCEPDIVLGHSVGQYAAAVVAGVMTLEEGLRLIAKRGELMGKLPRGGLMVAVFSSETTVAEILAKERELSIAADNGEQIVLSGPEETLGRVSLELNQRGVRTHRLNTSHAFHSHLMDPILEEFEAYACKRKFQALQRKLVCNVSGDLPAPGTVLGGEYWRRHIREPVRHGGPMLAQVCQGTGKSGDLASNAIRKPADG